MGVETPQDIEINPQFSRALELMGKVDQSLFITGKAGTGKSTLLEHFCASSKKAPVVLAPTGVAALNVRGQTIHRFFNFYIDVTVEKITSKEMRPRDASIYKKIRTIIIDEISMVRADLLDCIDVFLRMYGKDASKPFGGVQMIFIGDLYQLPPVVTQQERDIFNGYYKTPYFFSAQVMEHVPLELIELEKVYRQKDQLFIDLLNKIRNNSVEADDLELLNSRYQQESRVDDKDFHISLTTTNKNADAINDEHLDALDTSVLTSDAEIEGEFGKEYYPTALELEYKIGAQIMLLSNDQKQRWVNGSIGVIEAEKTDAEGEPYLRVRLQDNDRAVSVYAHQWEVYRFTLKEGAIVSEPAGTFTQYPFRLAWAVTIHKSQGKTFDKVVIDIGSRGTFVAGQMYVGLSRCTSFDGITLKTPIQKQHIRTDYRIVDFFTHYHLKRSEMFTSTDDKCYIIQRVIDEGGKINMTYLKADDTQTTSIIVPETVGAARYQGKEYLGMRAFCEKQQETRMFRVERILEMEEVV